MKNVEYAPYMPSCGTEMMQFYANFCDRCADPDEILWNETQEGSGIGNHTSIFGSPDNIRR